MEHSLFRAGQGILLVSLESQPLYLNTRELCAVDTGYLLSKPFFYFLLRGETPRTPPF